LRAVWTDTIAYIRSAASKRISGMDFSHIGRWPPDSSTIFGLGILAGVALFWWTGVPEVGLIAAAAVKILLPQHRPGEEENSLDVVEEVAETLA
jgi:hypothetical protein